MPRLAIALDISRTRVRALLGRRDGGILKVQKVFAEDVPDDLASDDAAAMGMWVGKRLREAGFPKAPTTIALARQHVGLKRLTLPTIDPIELPQMTRLAMQRQLPFDAETAVIDFLPIASSETSTTVLAVAVPQAILEHALNIAKAAKLKVQRVSLRGMGSALLLRHLGEEIHQSILAVDVLNDAIEFCVIDGGAVRFSRSAELTQLDSLQDGGFVADTIITETRRTWMSYRISEDSSDVRHVVIVGDAQLGVKVAEPLAKMLKVDAEVLEHHPLVQTNGHEMSRVWPLAGLLLESGHGGETIDFANPRKEPDLAAVKRKQMFLAASLGLLVLMASWTVAKRNLDSLEFQLAEMQAKRQQLYPERLRLHRDVLKLRHVELWESANPDWLEHLAYLSSIAPEASRVVFDGWSGTANISPVQFDRRSNEWSVPGQFTIVVNGEAVDRVTADSLREGLVRTAVYATSSTGADAAGGRRLPYGFTYRLRTADSAPQVEQSEQVNGESAAEAEEPQS